MTGWIKGIRSQGDFETIGIAILVRVGAERVCAENDFVLVRDSVMIGILALN